MRLEMLCRHRHPDAVAEALAERPGGSLDARSHAVLGMPRSSAPQLPEMLDVVQGQIVAGEIEQAVEEHRAVTSREHKPVAPEPFWIFGIVAHEARIEQVPGRGHPHRQSAM